MQKRGHKSGLQNSGCQELRTDGDGFKLRFALAKTLLNSGSFSGASEDARSAAGRAALKWEQRIASLASWRRLPVKMTCTARWTMVIDGNVCATTRKQTLVPAQKYRYGDELVPIHLGGSP